MPTVTNLTSGSGLTTGSGSTWSLTTGSVNITGVPFLTVSTYVSSGSANPPDPTVTGCGMTWTVVNSVQDDSVGTDRASLYMFMGTGSPSPGALTVTFNSTVAPRAGWVLDQITGITGAKAYPAPSNVGPSDVTLAVALNPSAAGNVVYAAFGVEAAGPTFSPGSGFTAVATSNGQNYAAAFTEYTLTAGTSNATATWSTPGRCGVVAVEMVGAGSGGITTGSAAGSASWQGAASGSSVHQGSVPASLAWAGTATGISSAIGTATGSLAWQGSATGSTPALDARQGGSAGTVLWHGSAIGSTPFNDGYAIGGIAWGGSATGARPPTFEPPYVMEVATDEPGLLSRVLLARGVTVLKKDGFYSQVRYPTPEQVADADIAYLGGHIYQITSEEAAALVAAGYEVTR